MKTVVFSAAAAADLDRLQKPDRSRVEEALYAYAISGQGNVKRLTGRDEFRLRVGRFRVIFDQDQVTILAIYIGTRETTTYRRH